MKMIWLKYLGAALAAAALFLSGYKYAAAIYEADIADMQAQHALALKEKTDEYRAKEQSQAQQLADAWDQLERARAESADLRVDVDRVRNQAAALERKLSKSSAASCASERELLAGCTSLLARGEGLVERCERVARDSATKHDAVVKLHPSN
ncbi:hypothetical protein [Duodenibacillus massiliensis]|uniref:hypothetical protein n=2 Tax=Duodenibacillus massiliensis TaxID=1852381 RepID=UPI003078E211